jgi:tetratricopeptide (TPR) repeat protein
MRASVGQLIQAADKAVQLDAQDAFAHHALGHAYAMQGQIEPSLEALARGVELAPNDPMANGCYAMQLAASARAAEALEVIGRVMAISPEDPWQHRFTLVRARAHFVNAEYPDSEEWAMRSLQLRPTQGAFLHSVAAPAMGDGLERAKERTEQGRARQPLPPLAGIRKSFLRATDPEYVDRLVEGLRRAGFE